MLIKASAPGSIMLLGEYSVLYEGYALVCAVEKRIHVQLTLRTDDQIELISSLGTHKTKLTQLEIIPPFQFILAIFKKFQKYLQQGCTLTVESEFSEHIGLASSAAVTVATLAAFTHWLHLSYSSSQLIQEARSIVQEVQGLGSGADVAACVLGGLVAYRTQPFLAKKIDFISPITLVYSGSKTPTVTAVNKVETFFSRYPQLYQQLLHAIDECAQQGIAAAEEKDVRALGQLMNIQQGLMDALGVNTPTLRYIIEKLRLQSTLWGAKISGSGLGDCVVALGAISDPELSQFAVEGAKEIPVAVATQGVYCEKTGCH
ncbi:MAG: galK [Gammaproteobacteria bacterium]|jgi:mevalonate kinase|nr:galK [Gammaproteobacteria bacterium]